MSDNKYLWTLGLPANEFVDSLDLVVHFSGIKIGTKFLIEEDRDLLKLVGQKLYEFSNELIDKDRNLYIVKLVNTSRHNLSSIYSWLETTVPLEAEIYYSLKDILGMVNGLIADKTIEIPLFDTRFLPRSNLGQCIQVNYEENKKIEQQFVEYILCPGFYRDMLVHSINRRTYKLEITQTDSEGNPMDMKKYMRFQSYA